jgi:glucose uptake protein GlcU
MIAAIASFFSGAWAKLGTWIIGIGAILAAVAGVLLTVRNAGEDEQKEVDTAATLKSVTEASNVENEVAATPATARRDELQQWTE